MHLPRRRIRVRPRGPGRHAPALVLAAALATAPPAPAAGPALSGDAPARARLDAVRRRYDALWESVNRPRILGAAVWERLIERVAVAAQTVTALAAEPAGALAAEPDAGALADLERRAELDEIAVPALLAGVKSLDNDGLGALVGG